MNRCSYCGIVMESNEHMESHAGDNCINSKRAKLYIKFKHDCVATRIVKDCHVMTKVTGVQTWLNMTPDEMFDWIVDYGCIADETTPSKV